MFSPVFVSGQNLNEISRILLYSNGTSIAKYIAIDEDYMVTCGSKTIDPMIIWKKASTGNWEIHQEISLDYLGDLIIPDITMTSNYIFINYFIADSSDIVIYKRDSVDRWRLNQRINANNDFPNGIRGNLAVDDSVFVVGYSSGKSNTGIASGHVMIFELDSTSSWKYKALVSANKPVKGDQFGAAVAVCKGRIIIGAPSQSTDQNNVNRVDNAGAAYIFEKSNGTWVQIQKLVAKDRAYNLYFGKTVDINEKYVVVGAPDATVRIGSGVYFQAGLVYVMPKNKSGYYTDIQVLQDSKKNDYVDMGQSIALDDSLLYIGSNAYRGIVHIFSDSNGVWKYQHYIMEPSDHSTTGFSQMIDASDGHLAVCAPRYTNYLDNYYKKGRVNVYSSSGVNITAFQDNNADGVQDENEIGLAGRNFRILPGNIYGKTNEFGVMHVNGLKDGDYKVLIADKPGLWELTTKDSVDFEIKSNKHISSKILVGFKSKFQTAIPSVNTYMPFRRRCFSNQAIYLEVCNDISANGSLDSTIIHFNYDTLIQVYSGNYPYKIIKPGLIELTIDSIYPGYCKKIIFKSKISCEATWNEPLCFDVKIVDFQGEYISDSIDFENASNCYNKSDSSIVVVQSTCQSDSVVFQLQNKGLKGHDMQCFKKAYTFIDGNLIASDSIKLAYGEITTLRFPASGEDYHLLVQQTAYAKQGAYASASVLGCNANNSTQKRSTNTFYQNNTAMEDSYCGKVTGSYDPNDKTGFPPGIGEKGEIFRNQDIDFVIRFQNTGNDTAFKVVIRDTIRKHFDLGSLKSGMSSHPYTYKIVSPNIAEWTFTDIMLPDSNTDEKNSHGFIRFSISQVRNLPYGTVLNNSAEIYFDFNKPIYTNVTTHTVYTPEKKIKSYKHSFDSIHFCDSTIVNGITHFKSGEFKYVKRGTKEDTIFQVQIKKAPIVTSVFVQDSIFVAGDKNVVYQWLDCNENFKPIDGATKRQYIPTKSGSYAVIFFKDDCKDTSDCYSYRKASIDDVTSTIPAIYPNPSNSFFIIKLMQNDTKHFAECFDIQGKLIFKKLLNDIESKISTDGLTDGVYTIKVTNNKFSTYSKLLIRKQ